MDYKTPILQVFTLWLARPVPSHWQTPPFTQPDRNHFTCRTITNLRQVGLFLTPVLLFCAPHLCPPFFGLLLSFFFLFFFHTSCAIVRLTSSRKPRLMHPGKWVTTVPEPPWSLALAPFIGAETPTAPLFSLMTSGLIMLRLVDLLYLPQTFFTSCY